MLRVVVVYLELVSGISRCARVYLSLVCAVSFGYVQGLFRVVQGLFRVYSRLVCGVVWGCFKIYLEPV